MRTVHGIDTYDQPSFFSLHDSNTNSYLEPSELAHFYRQNVGDGNEEGFKQWTAQVLKVVDINKDGKISYDEYRRPAFEDRIFSHDGGGDGTPAHGSVGTSAWTQQKVVMKDGKRVFEYHGFVPMKYRIYKG